MAGKLLKKGLHYRTLQKNQFDSSESHDTMIRTPGGRILRFSGPTALPVLGPRWDPQGAPGGSAKGSPPHAGPQPSSSTTVTTVKQHSSSRLEVQQTSTTTLLTAGPGGPPSVGPSRKTSQFSQLNFIAPSDNP